MPPSSLLEYSEVAVEAKYPEDKLNKVRVMHDLNLQKSDSIVEIDHAAEARDHLLELSKCFPEDGLSERTMDTLDHVIITAKKLKRQQMMKDIGAEMLKSGYYL